MYDDVVKFIEACEQEKNLKNIALYANLITEEYKEFIESCNNVNDVESLDACMDMIWVILGFCYMKGYDIEGAWKEVSRSNLAKINPVTGKVNKRLDGKVLKPADWTPPQLGQFVK